MTKPRTVVVSATVVTTDESQVARAAEVLGRAAAGLVLDGVPTNLSLMIADDDPLE